MRSLCLSFLVLVIVAPASAEVDWPDLQEQIEAREYEVTFQRQLGSYQAPNRAHGFRTLFVAPGIRLVPREETEAAWEWGLTWIGYGRGNLSWPVPETTPAPVRSRMDYARGALSEWYENSPRGLKQGFVLSASPEELFAGSGARASSAEPLHLEFALSGTLSPVVAADGRSIDFVRGDGTRILRYAELVVEDARGREVRSWMEAFVRGDVRIVRLVLDAKDVVFPLKIDPLATTPVWTFEVNQASASLGASVANAGDVDGDGLSDIVVGLPLWDGGQTNEGGVLFFRGTPSGPVAIWAYEDDVSGGANFGASVGTAGDVNGDGFSDIVVGAPGYDNPENNEGRAYVFLGSAQGPGETPAWTVESNIAFSSFGSSVGTAGDVNGDGYSDVVVGAATAGRAYLYTGSPSGPSTVHAWQASSTSTSRFGAAVGTAGDVNGDGYADVVIGAPNYENGQTAEGAVFVYPGSAAGLGATPWFSEGDHAGAVFGSSVGTAGDVNGDGYADVIVGAPLYDFGQADEGLAFLYLGSSTGVTFSPAWFGESDQIAGHYGSSVGTAGDVNGDGYADFLVAGEQITNGQSNEGRAWLYYGGPTLPQAPAWTHESNQTGAGIKMAVATAGDVNGDGYADVLVGFQAFDNGQTDEGQVRLFLGSAAAMSMFPGWTKDGTQPDDFFGSAVGGAGDVNGDGYADFLVAAPTFSYRGVASAYLGSPSGPSASAAWTFDSNQGNADLGHYLGSAGDVNGDGYADVIVGARFYDGGFTDQGRAWVFHGSAAGIGAVPAWTATVDEANAYFGLGVGTAGDINGDGFADIIVGASGVDGATGQGAAYVYHGSVSGLSPTPQWVATCHVGDARFGVTVGTAGDVNRDGYADVLVGAPKNYSNNDPNPPPSGPDRVYLYLGSASGLSASHAWMIEQPEPLNEGMGVGLGTAGDVNGDGFSDVVVGSPFFEDGLGRVSVYHGSAIGLSPAPSWTVVSLGSFNFGYSVAAAGDVNGDGYGDLVVGGSASALLYQGSAAGLATTEAWWASAGGGQTAVSGAGDVNGDGYADVIVGAELAGVQHRGRAMLFYGNGGLGAPLIPAQGRGGDGVPIQRWGASDSPAFYLNAVARTPFGRGKVRFETEVERLDRTFDGLLTTLGSPTDAGTGLMLESLEANLASGTPYHWRVRLHYDPATTPFATRSRWFTVPWGGWNEAMLRTPGTPLGRVEGGGGGGLMLQKEGPGITASWVDAGSCLETDQAVALYEGTLGNFTSHVPVACYVVGSDWTFTPQAGNRYFLLAPVNWVAEGSHGLDGDGNERPRGTVSCQAQQQIGACP